MKKILYTLLIACSLFFTSCEDVIDLDLNQYEKRVVIDANIFVGENDYNKIKVYYSAPFYATSYEYISTAIVTIKDLNTNIEYPFTYISNGNYENNSFNPSENNEYELQISYDGKIYKAYSNVTKSPIIENVEQINDAGFMGDSYELRFYYQDNPDEEDYYLTQTIDLEENDFSVGNDQFTNGNLSYELYFADKEQLAETIYFSLAKIDKAYYNYLSKMFSNAAAGGNPFATPTGTLKGNITNTSNIDDFPLGYFHIAKRESVDYTIQ